ncbi:hypothetical protein [Pseudomonas sp. R9.37]
MEVVMHDAAVAKRVGELHAQLWEGPYSIALDVAAQYPDPHPGKP